MNAKPLSYMAMHDSPGTGQLGQVASADEAAAALSPLGFEKVKVLPGTTYRDVSTIVVVPTRGTIHWKVVAALQTLIAPMNQKRAVLFAAGDEVAAAYNNLIANVLADPSLSTWKYVLTIEDDNLVPPDAHVRLLESIEAGDFAAAAGLYFTKGEIQMPMAFGDPEEFVRTGVLDFRPRDVVQAIQRGHLVEVNGVAMGCTLWRLDLFRQFPAPWFQTVNDIVPEQGIRAYTQDLFFCERIRRAGKRLVVDTRVHVGHFDAASGAVY